ncbi:LLM class F420-dependent oxidoreductase [Microbacterium sp. LRZ72]|uniref:LLM class F420-dependent oxidoreductase n=1 Tax=Microbacterium sp. LRZ72 TaxID=2942481 RepID=UPI0029B6C4B9|nr:LLM class F420-dependent oxidoreductase [Microbacterium sp. LRZ72]MDX2377532.1 LLM class F420-dependent oxidoreductase [Microbacterium sp. LRZ72]
MRAGLHFWNFTVPGAPHTLADLAVDTVRTAEEGGFDQLTVMDHWFQMEAMGEASEPMLEAFTTLGFLAGHTSRIRLGPLVSGVTYRHPGILAKTATTLDVLSRGRSMLGMGAAWYEREHAAMGVAYPPLSERFERLEEAVQIVLQMWGTDEGPYAGHHYGLAETLNRPQPVSQPHPPILIGGKGPRKTLRIGAQYAQIVNFTTSDVDEVAHLMDVLRRHCDALGTDFDAIEKQVMAGRRDPFGDDFLPDMQRLRALGIDLAVLNVRKPDPRGWTERLATEVLPHLTEV